ncbi:hypothetical protein F5Y00DRAFT_172399 [Daldinia vernicosa]|uniref:uncharacterized protein n=1 Tax=Daldinia vernicosa TaxID=114800 RepID=UPI00200802DD|nr:uncharacterized protein F5Y00DRAFT_172399 [Daldinia vernicosa]KAI0845237.1 hypothetical protein F5Y00DRAFT_172399 [Daldinia vernicosa]
MKRSYRAHGAQVYEYLPPESYFAEGICPMNWQGRQADRKKAYLPPTKCIKLMHLMHLMHPYAYESRGYIPKNSRVTTVHAQQNLPAHLKQPCARGTSLRQRALKIEFGIIGIGHRRRLHQPFRLLFFPINFCHIPFLTASITLKTGKPATILFPFYHLTSYLYFPPVINVDTIYY